MHSEVDLKMKNTKYTKCDHFKAALLRVGSQEFIPPLSERRRGLTYLASILFRFPLGRRRNQSSCLLEWGGGARVVGRAWIKSRLMQCYPPQIQVLHIGVVFSADSS